VSSSLLLSGFDVRSVDFGDSPELLLPPIPQPSVENALETCARALEEPVAGPPLSALLKGKKRLCILVDDFTLPMPPASRDARRDMIEAVLDALADAGIRPAQVRVLVATGLSRQWRPAELTDVLGARATALVPSRCHDALDARELKLVGESPTGPLELARAQAETDLCIHLNLVAAPALAGSMGLVMGTTGLDTWRELNTPKLFEGAPLWSESSSWRAAHEAAAAVYAKQVPVFQVAAVLDNALWGQRMASFLDGIDETSRPVQLWNALPEAVRHRAARLMRAEHAPIEVFAGAPSEVAPKALEAFARQHEVTSKGEADVLVFGIPDVGPFSFGTAQNPVLVAHVALALVGQLASGGHLLREGGALVFANPLKPGFDSGAHRAYEQLFEKVLRHEREPEAIETGYAMSLLSDQSLSQAYRHRYAFHPAHALASWAQCAPLRRRAARIFVAHGDPRACARLGFTAAPDTVAALARAREAVGGEPKVRVLGVPPPFFVRV
jgi:lactate racemase